LFEPGEKPGPSRNGRDTEALSTSSNRASVSPSWKQEVNQRVAAHKDRKASSVAEPDAVSETHSSASKRAVAAAARVAARFRNAPSYSEQLADEARAAVRAAEAASKAALEAQAAAESVLAGLEAAAAAQPVLELRSSPAAGPERRAAQAGQAIPEPPKANSGTKEYEVRWEPDMPVRPSEPAAVYAMHRAETPESEMGSWSEPAWPDQDRPGGEPIVPVEPAQPIHANVIEFPREIVATRKARPRRVEGLYAATEGQLSIFEVDPGSISIEPASAGAADADSAPAWEGPEWSGIELDAQPRREFQGRASVESRNEQNQEPDAAGTQDGASHLDLAPINRRLMAALVNGSLIVAAFLATGMEAASKVKALPPLREIELVAALALAALATLYHALFYAFAVNTPGMKFAGIALCTFDGRNPTRAQRFGRLAALLLSVLPVGLGVMWAIFDEDHLSWHDRLSQTYLRKS
jgi:uncharacterized RDD family membrane protein YckC